MSKKTKVQIQAGILAATLLAFFVTLLWTPSCRRLDIGKDNFSYQVVKINGMTCIQWGHSISYKGGLTCNWDEWEENN
jgi:hypothetical protein